MVTIIVKVFFSLHVVKALRDKDTICRFNRVFYIYFQKPQPRNHSLCQHKPQILVLTGSKGKSESRSVVSYSLQPHRLYSAWNSPGQILELVVFSSPGDLPNPGIKPRSPHCRRIFYQLSHKGNPGMMDWVAYPFSSGSSQPRNAIGISFIAGGFFTS